MQTKKDKLMEMSIDDFKKKNRLDTVAPLLDAKVEFSYIPLKFIVVEEQVRSEDEITGGEEFQSMVDSIRENGVLEPVLVVEMPGNKYKLVTGERRYRAVSYTHLRAHETPEHLVCRLLLEKKKNSKI